MKRSMYSPDQTSKLPGGSDTLDRQLDKIKATLDVLSSLILSNATEDNGVWLVKPGGEPTGNPPAGCFFVYVRRSDGKLVSRGSKGTITVLGAA